jgi:uncharacterized repeat protein (TIGR02543 family)
MLKTGFITEAHAIASLTAKFTLNGNGFRIYLKKKTTEAADVLMVTGKCFGSDTEVTIPCNADQWSDVLFKEIAATGITLTGHDLYFGVKDPIRYSVHYNLDGGQFISEAGALVATYDNQVQWGTKATEPEVEPTLYDHTFKGWYIGENEFDFDTLIYANTTITAVYQENLVVTFDSAGGTAVAPISVLEGETIIQPTSPTKSGYTFNAWTLSGETFDFRDPITDDITLVATWLENFTVTFNSDGGSSVSAQEIADGNTATAPTAPTKDGYTFNEWYDGETLFNFTTPITSDITLTAHWLENFTVTFDSQGGSEVTAQEVADGSTATEPTPDPTKEANTFLYWSLTAEGTEFAFTTPITADTTLYAIWDPE